MHRGTRSHSLIRHLRLGLAVAFATGCGGGADAFEDVTLGSEYSDLPTISVEGSVLAEIEG